LLYNGSFVLAKDSALLAPCGGDIRVVYNIDEIALEVTAAEGNGIGFKEAGFGFVPLIRLD